MNIDAKNFVNSQGLIVESASLLADAIVGGLKQELDVEVSLAGVKGASSSYFNVILQRLAEQFGADAAEHRVKFTFDTKAQRDVFNRSLDAIKKPVS